MAKKLTVRLPIYITLEIEQQEFETVRNVFEKANAHQSVADSVDFLQRAIADNLLPDVIEASPLDFERQYYLMDVVRDNGETCYIGEDEDNDWA